MVKISQINKKDGFITKFFRNLEYVSDVSILMLVIIILGVLAITYAAFEIWGIIWAGVVGIIVIIMAFCLIIFINHMIFMIRDYQYLDKEFKRIENKE